MARGISTVIGALLFLLVASLLLALALRAFNETVLALNEVANNQRAGVEQLGIKVSYTKWSRILASDAIGSVDVIQGAELTLLDPSLLNALDGQAIRVAAQRLDGEGGGGGETVQLIRNGGFDEDFKYWTYSPVEWWSIDNGRAHCRADLGGGSQAKASLNQTFTLDFTPTTAVLSFQYMWDTFPPGQEKNFILQVLLLKNNQIVWWGDRNLVKQERNQLHEFRADLTGYLTEPGSYTLAFVLFMESKQKATFYFWLDNVSLVASRQPPPGVPGAAYQLSLVINLKSGITLQGSLYVSSNASVFLEVYRRDGGSWLLTEKRLLEKDVQTSVRLEGGGPFMLLAYSGQSFELAMDYLDAEALQLASVSVVISNLGTEPVDIYAVWLRNSSWEKRVDVKSVLLPNDSLEINFDTYLSLYRLYEVRVVTGTRTHIVRLTTSGG
ncbi:MAG: hypothetical protein QXT37_08390 [Thermofilaceae archaeon]